MEHAISKSVLVAIVLLSRTVIRVTRDYVAQRRAGRRPTFHIGDHPDLGQGVNRDIWK